MIPWSDRNEKLIEYVGHFVLGQLRTVTKILETNLRVNRVQSLFFRTNFYVADLKIRQKNSDFFDNGIFLCYTRYFIYYLCYVCVCDKKDCIYMTCGMYIMFSKFILYKTYNIENLLRITGCIFVSVKYIHKHNTYYIVDWYIHQSVHIKICI